MLDRETLLCGQAGVKWYENVFDSLTGCKMAA